MTCLTVCAKRAMPQIMSKELTPEKRDAILADYRAGELTVRQIAAKHDVSVFTPSSIAERCGVPLRSATTEQSRDLPDPPPTPIETPQAFRQGREALGMTVGGLAAQLGVSARTLRSWEQDPVTTGWSRRPNKAAIKLLEKMLSERYDDGNAAGY